MWSINSATSGGGVAEILRAMLLDARAGGIDARWLIMRADADSSASPSGSPTLGTSISGDGGPLGAAQRSAYERVLDGAGRAQRDVIGRAHVVVSHDPQTLGPGRRTQAPRRDGDLALPHQHRSAGRVMRGFAEHTLPPAQAHLVLAGPAVHTVTDDPEKAGSVRRGAGSLAGAGSPAALPGDRRVRAETSRRTPRS